MAPYKPFVRRAHAKPKPRHSSPLTFPLGVCVQCRYFGYRWREDTRGLAHDDVAKWYATLGLLV